MSYEITVSADFYNEIPLKLTDERRVELRDPDGTADVTVMWMDDRVVVSVYHRAVDDSIADLEVTYEELEAAADEVWADREEDDE